MKTTQLFKGSNVFMSRKLVPPEVFDTLINIFTLNGAEIFLFCDPSRSGPNDFHVIASHDHEKFKDLKAKGCNLLGPQCVISCATGGRPLPQGGFICCLAMDGLKVIASGFHMDEKVKIKQMVTSMGGVLLSKASSDVNFVIVKNVLSAKYKWGMNIQKPVVTLNWLYQCWNEHSVVPQTSYKIPPFLGLKICVTGIPADERNGIKKLISEYGGRYSADLTRRCTHLIADVAEGDKYKVAKKWGHIQIVSRKWFQQSIARKVCLNEESYPVLDPIPLSRGVRDSERHSAQEKFPGFSMALAHSYASNPKSRDSDVEAYASQNVLSTSMIPSMDIIEPSEGPTTELQVENIDGCTARDSESYDNDMYLSDCNICLLGFEASEMLRLVKLVRRGGGFRCKMLKERITHIVVGTPSESEKREARSVVASGHIQVVTPGWLEDCDRERKNIPVHKIYTAHNLILPRDSECLNKGTPVGMSGMKQCKSTDGQTIITLESGKQDEIHAEREIVLHREEPLYLLVNSKSKEQERIQCEFSGHDKEERKSSVFNGKTFCFSHSFPEVRRPEVVEWVNQGGGEVVIDPFIKNANFTIECHGVVRSAGTTQTTYVSTDWIRSCLEDGCLADVSSHILYSPLPCQTPLPGFQSLRFCVSQYEGKDRLQLRNLCVVLGAKFVEKLTKKVTHLLCNFANGPKYEAASRWGIVSVTSDWVYECVRQNKVVWTDNFHPKELTTQDKEAEFGLPSQFHTELVPMPSRDIESLLRNHSEDREKTQSFASETDCGGGEVNKIQREIEREEESFPSKKAKLLRDCQESDVFLLSSRAELAHQFPAGEHPSNSARPSNPADAIVSRNDLANVRKVDDIIDDMLEKTSNMRRWINRLLDMREIIQES